MDKHVCILKFLSLIFLTLFSLKRCLQYYCDSANPPHIIYDKSKIDSLANDWKHTLL